MALKELESLKVLPWFILSGQPSFTKERNRYADGFKSNQVYDKLNDAHLVNLWDDLKCAADKQKETQIRHRYKQAFDLCTDEYIGASAAKPLLMLLEAVEEVNVEYNTEENLNAARKIVEKLFSTFNKVGVIPDVVWKGAGNINNSGKLLTGRHPAYSLEEEIAPPVISHLLKSILNLTQDGSHAEGELSLKVDGFIKEQPTGFLFSGVIFHLMEVMVWSKTYLDKHQDFTKNKGIANLKHDLTSALVEGIIQQDSGGNYHCKDIIITYKHFGEQRFAVGDLIRVIRFGVNSNEKTKRLYSKVALITQKI